MRFPVARSPYTGVPDTGAPVDQPNDQLRVEASPASFGGALAQGLEAAGQGGIDYSKFYNQVAGDHAVNNLLAAGTSILHGDPNQPATDSQGQPILGPDGKPLPDTGFLGKRGADAMSAREDAQAKLDEAINEQRQSLPTPAARAAFENESRRYRAQFQSELANHADTQQKVWATDTNNTYATRALNDVGRYAADDTASAAAGERVRAALVKNAQLAGEDPNGAVLKADQTVALTRIRALSSPEAGIDGARKAEDVYNNSPELRSLPNYDQLGRQVKEQVFNATETPAVDKFVNDAMTSVTAHPAVSAQPGKPASPITEDQVGALIPSLFPGSTITSQYRTPEHNAAVGGVPNSLHTMGEAVDFKPPAGTTLPQIRAALESRGLPISELIDEGTHVHWGWGAKGGQGANQVASVSLGSPSSADALRLQMPTLLAKAQTQAESLFPNYPDYQARFVSNVERRLKSAVIDDTAVYTANTHLIQSVMASDHPPLSEAELLARGPQVAAAWRSMQFNNGLAALSVERMFDANASGKAADYGENFKDYLDRALAPQTDAARVKNPAQLYPFVGSGPDAPLTNTGVNQLSEILGIRGTPQGEAQAAQIKKFVDTMHGQLTFSNKATGVVDRNGEKIYSKFMAATLPTLVKAAKSGTLDDVLNPQSPHYAGALAQTVARSPAERLRDQAKDGEPPPSGGPKFDLPSFQQTLSSLDSVQQQRDAITFFAQSGRLTPQVYQAYLATLHHNPPPGAFEAPRPTVHVPGQP